MILNFDFDKMIQNVSKVKLHGGVVGKTCTVLIVIAITIFGICFVGKELWLCVIGILSILILTFVFLWKMISFADKNPHAALLEGAEFLLHEKIQLAAKNLPMIPFDIKDFIEDKQIPITDEMLENSKKPDQQSKIESEENND